MRARTVISGVGRNPRPALPGDLVLRAGAVRDRRELVPGKNPEDVGAWAVLGLRAPGVGDDQGSAVRAGPEDYLVAGEGPELVLREHGLPRADRELGDVLIAEAGVLPWAEPRDRDNPRAVRGEERVEGGDGQDVILVEERQDDLGSGETVARGGGVEEPDLHGAGRGPARLLESKRLSGPKPGEDLAVRIKVHDPALT